jgi:hypothetical protein
LEAGNPRILNEPVWLSKWRTATGLASQLTILHAGLFELFADSDSNSDFEGFNVEEVITAGVFTAGNRNGFAGK